MLDGALLDGPILELPEPMSRFSRISPRASDGNDGSACRDIERSAGGQVGLTGQRVHEDAAAQGASARRSQTWTRALEDRLAGVEEEHVVGILACIRSAVAGAAAGRFQQVPEKSSAPGFSGFRANVWSRSPSIPGPGAVPTSR